MNEEHRNRLLGGMLEAIADAGYADVTTADIVRRARVSKRTFYDHFDTKEELLLALYEAESTRLLEEIESAIRDLPAGNARIAAGAAVYLTRLQTHPRVVRTMWIEILQLGPKGLAMRRRVMRRFADLFVREFEATSKRKLSPATAMALVGGINELALEAFEDNRLEGLTEIGAVLEELLQALLLLPAKRKR